MTLLAHLSDLHLVEDTADCGRGHRRTLAEHVRLRYLSFGRPIDTVARRERVQAALAEVRHARADHLVVTGDLTEDGTVPQLELLAELLGNCGMPPDRITLVPGNHDGYHDPGSWQRMLDGPLRPFADTSRPGGVVPLDDAYLVPLSTMHAQPFTRSAGALGSDQLDTLSGWAIDLGKRRPVVLAQHHPPSRYAPGAQWVQGLLDHEALATVLLAYPHLHVLHGHTHDRTDRRVSAADELERVFCTTAVVESASPLRLYRVEGEGLMPDG